MKKIEIPYADLLRDVDADRKRHIRRARRKANLCVTCGAPAHPGSPKGGFHSLCKTHLDKDAERKGRSPSRVFPLPLEPLARDGGTTPDSHLYDLRHPEDRKVLEEVMRSLRE